MRLIASLLLALTTTFVTALPQQNVVVPLPEDTFNIVVVNNCTAPKTLGIYGVTPSFQMLQVGKTYEVDGHGHNITVAAPFLMSGLRLSANGDWPLAQQWKPQLLFEFGYSKYAGIGGTAYDISMMLNSHSTIGMAVKPIPNGLGSNACPRKRCVPGPGGCPASQGWTYPGQVSLSSPADAVCYHGKTDFQVTYCPA